jgi:uncharacterized membrane protein YidH (DUF202 family)
LSRRRAPETNNVVKGAIGRTSIETRTFLAWVALTLLVAFGIVLNPLVTSLHVVEVGVLAGEGVAGLALVAVGVYRAYRIDRREERVEVATIIERNDCQRPSLGAIAAFVATLAAWAFIHRDRWPGTPPFSDDYYYLGSAQSWARVKADLFAPFHEHFIVPQRLISYLVVAAGRRIGEPIAMQLAGAVLFLMVAGLLFAMARRRFRSEAATIVALVLFCLCGSVREPYHWFSASLWLVPLILLLLALVALTPRSTRLAPARIAIASAIALVAPFSYSIGLAAGPIATVWLWSQRGERGPPVHWLATLAPTLATGAWLLLLGPGMLAWFRTDEYLSAGVDSLKDFDFFAGLACAVKLSVDKLLLANVGLSGGVGAWWAHAAVFPLVPIALVVLLRRRPATWRFVLLLLAMAAIGYGLTLPFRATVRYDELIFWDRYQLIPQLGLALFFAGIADTAAHRHGPNGWRRLSKTDGRWIAALIAAMTLLQAFHSVP